MDWTSIQNFSEGLYQPQCLFSHYASNHVVFLAWLKLGLGFKISFHSFNHAVKMTWKI